MGVVLCRRSHVVLPSSPQGSRLSCGDAIFSPGHRRPYAHHQSSEESRRFVFTIAFWVDVQLQDLGSVPNDIVVALDGLSNIVNQDLARDLSRDIYAMLNHSRAHIRKRAVLVLYKIFLRYPETLEQNFSRLKEKLEDPRSWFAISCPHTCPSVNIWSQGLSLLQ